jgi:Leu/Phe-tRNA-protein transferase
MGLIVVQGTWINHALATGYLMLKMWEMGTHSLEFHELEQPRD